MLSLLLTLVATTEELSLQAQVHELRSLVRDQGEELAALKSEVAALKSDNEELQRRVGTPSTGNPPLLHSFFRHCNSLATVCRHAELGALPAGYPPPVCLGVHIRAQGSSPCRLD